MGEMYNKSIMGVWENSGLRIDICDLTWRKELSLFPPTGGERRP
jgi:hypothetical protein